MGMAYMLPLYGRNLRIAKENVTLVSLYKTYFGSLLLAAISLYKIMERDNYNLQLFNLL